MSTDRKATIVGYAIIAGVIVFYAYAAFAADTWASHFKPPRSTGIAINLAECSATACDGAVLRQADSVEKGDAAQWRERVRWTGPDAAFLAEVAKRGCVIDDGTRPSGFAQPLPRCVKEKNKK